MSLKASKIERIIALIEEYINRRIDPFKINVSKILEDLRQTLNQLSDEELALDIEALNRVVDLIKEQENWVKNEAKLMALGPLTLVLKIKNINPEDLVSIFIKTWHPIVYSDLLTISDIRLSLKYVDSLKKFSKLLSEDEINLRAVEKKPLNEIGFLLKEEFKVLLKRTQIKIDRMLKDKEEIDYWTAIMDSNFEKTIQNAIALAYLISLGLYSLRMDPIKGKFFLMRKKGDENPYSIALSISYDEWVKFYEHYKKSKKS